MSFHALVRILGISSVVAASTLLAVDSALPKYEPRPASPMAGARYVQRDGSIRIVGAEHAQHMVEGFNQLFARSHPGSRFKLDLKGTSTGIPSLTHGVTPFAPLGRNVTSIELVPYSKIVGEAPVEIRVARASHTSKKTAQPLAVYVHRSNPLDRLTMEQVRQIFTTGDPKGDIATWGQLGLATLWKNRVIHTYGTAEPSGFGSFMQQFHFAGLPLKPTQELATNSAAIVERIAADPAGIGIASVNFSGADVKIVALSATGEGEYSRGSAEDAMNGKYPLARYLYFYVRRVPGQPIDPWVKEYFRLVFSKEGQSIVEADPEKYFPLSATEAAAELAKLN
jgi:phosphate transport system substrate-binding protein